MTFQLRLHSLRALIGLDLPPFAASLATAELFFKFGSFLIEGAAFVALWHATNVVYGRLARVTVLALSRSSGQM